MDTKTILKYSFIGICYAVLFSSVVFADDDFIPRRESSEVYSSEFILNALNEDTDVSIKFGMSLSEYLTWNKTFSRFDLSDTLRVQGNLESNGNVLMLDADNVANGANVDIIANQGTDGQGTLRYNSTTNQWEIQNNGEAFSVIQTGLNMVTPFSQNILSGHEIFLTHSSDSNYKRVVEIFFSNISTLVWKAWNIIQSDENAYILENASLVDFFSNTIFLSPSQDFSAGATNMSLGGTALSSDQSRNPDFASDNSSETFWYNQLGGGSSGQWWGVDFGQELSLIRVEIEWFSSYYATDMEIQGSHDGITWDLVSSVSPTGNSTEAFDFSPATYRYWRVYCITGADPSYFSLKEGRFFEVEGSGFPLTPVYVSTGSTNQIGTNSWESIQSTRVFGQEPLGTSLRFLFSFDNRNTWKAFLGGVWENKSLSNIENEGMTKSEVESLSESDWNAVNGLRSDPADTLNFAVSLETTDSGETPTFSGIEFDYTTNSFWERVQEGKNARLRYISPTVTSITNLMDEAKDFKINVILPFE